MRIAQVSPLAESVPPQLYGGTERAVYYLTEELVRAGHDVTLFASGDSSTSATLVSPCDRAVRRLGLDAAGSAAALTLMCEQVAQHVECGAFDIVHFHIDHAMWPLARRLGVPYLTTLHGRLDIPALGPLFAEFSDAPLISISDAQRRPHPNARWLATIHHGLPESLYAPGPGDGGYLAFLGRISPEKRPDRAIAIAERAQVPLKIAAKVDDADRAYFEAEIQPLLDTPWVEFIGEIDDHAKQDFLGRAAALLFPIDWPEPFGLAMIEALACGTPVIAFDAGSVPEVIRHGITGFIVNNVEEAARAVEDLALLSRLDCRAEFEQRFSARRMADDYLVHYQQLLREAASARKPPRAAFAPRSDDELLRAVR